MASGESLAQVPLPTSLNVVDFVYAFLFLVPGYVSYKVALQYCANENEHSEFEKIAWSLLGSGISISVLVVLFALFAPAVGASSTSDLSSVGAGTLAGSYLAILVIAAVVGRVGAYGYDNVLQGGINVVKGNSWSRFSEMVHQRSLTKNGAVSVQVVTKDGAVFEGFSKIRGTTQRDMLLMVPVYDEGADGAAFSHFRYVYLPEDEIRRVETDEDVLSLGPTSQPSDERLGETGEGEPGTTAGTDRQPLPDGCRERGAASERAGHRAGEEHGERPTVEQSGSTRKHPV
jgi:hypothetical protein